MTTPDFPSGTPCWIELFTTDPDGAATFYRDLFGWDQVSAGEEFGGYRNFLLDGSMMGWGPRGDGRGVGPRRRHGGRLAGR
jgi:hypothetical protein